MAWLGWERVDGNSAGTWATGPVRPKLVLHTTEGTTTEGALATYRARNSWPHATVDPGRRRRVQHVSLDVPARALRNEPGGVETNRAPRVIQVEIMGFARETHTWSTEDLDWLGREVVGPLCQAGGVPLAAGVDFHGEGAGWILASTTARQRLTGQAWLDYSGILGHQHVVENDHWDPGRIDIARIIAAAQGPQPRPLDIDPDPPTEELTVADITEITTRLDQVAGEVAELRRENAELRTTVDAVRSAVDTVGRRVRAMHAGNYQDPRGDLTWLEERLAPLAERLDRIDGR